MKTREDPIAKVYATCTTAYSVWGQRAGYLTCVRRRANVGAAGQATGVSCQSLPSSAAGTWDFRYIVHSGSNRRAAGPLAFCVANCSGKVCGSDGCGGSCGTCTAPDSCASGQCVATPSCIGLAAMCGPSGDTNCCESTLVPGATFDRSYDGVTFTDSSFPAAVSNFDLDVYEMTVGRFRRFLAAYPTDLPVAGAGKNPNNPSDAGWDPSWNSLMLPDAPSVMVALNCDPSWVIWTDTPGANEERPLNCITWYEALAFCIWDGGRLPTEAEWNYAAAGGSDQRVYPWSIPSTSTGIDGSYAVYCQGSPCDPAQNVGARSPKGDSKWGQSDMAGNLWEWVQDRYESPYPAGECINCANLTPGTEKVFRGGSFYYNELYQTTSGRSYWHPLNRGHGLGVRCARTAQ
jgi:formylglycine-generating enzyme